MTISAKQAFAKRLVEAMLEAGHRSARGAKSGVDVHPLARAAKVTREMARRYTDGTAIPDVNKMQEIADWLGVRLGWLRDGEGPPRSEALSSVREAAPPRYDVSDEALEVAKVWSRLSADTRYMLRDLIFILSLAERRFPWLRRGKPTGETYDQWERRQQRAFEQLAAAAETRKA